MKHTKLILTILLVQSLALVGCGGGSGSDDDSSSSSSGGESGAFVLYEGGPRTLMLDSMEVTPVPSQWGSASESVQHDPAFATATGIVWDVLFSGKASVALVPGDTSAIDDANGAVRYVNMAETGALVFDLRVVEIDSDTELLAKIGSGWPFASFKSIDIPEDDEWHTIQVPFSEMVKTAEPAGYGEVQLSHIKTMFALESLGGDAHLQINNIHITCTAECGIEVDLKEKLTESFDVLVDGQAGEHWFGVTHWDNGSESIVITTAEDDSEDAKGTVTDVTMGGTVGGEMYVITFDDKDLSAFEHHGYISFDLRVLNVGNNVGNRFKIWPASSNGRSAQYLLVPTVALGEWETVTVKVSDLLSYSDPQFDLSAITKPFALFPAGSQSGVHYQLDNVRWVIPE